MRKRAELRVIPIVIMEDEQAPQRGDGPLARFSQELVVKNVQSTDRLFAETALFLHRDAGRLPDEQRSILEHLQSPELLAGRTVLIVDDDVRNIFAMTSLLERHQMKVVAAENGREALECLRAHPEVEAVLMDIMLPEMDGYETTRAIRRMPDRCNLPILALTAKAMKRDREKCIEAGASDYVAKPVETEHLLALLRSWLHR
jgi:hypothetical protein